MTGHKVITCLPVFPFERENIQQKFKMCDRMFNFVKYDKLYGSPKFLNIFFHMK